MFVFCFKNIDNQTNVCYIIFDKNICLEERMKKIVFIISLLFVISFVLGRLEINTQAGENSSEYKSYYKSVKINYGDDLNSIAKKYNNSVHLSDIEYIDSLININNLADRQLHPGCYLTVFYY